VVQHLPSKCKALGSVPSSGKKKKKKKKEKKRKEKKKIFDHTVNPKIVFLVVVWLNP